MNTTHEPSAIGVYDDLQKAEHAIDELRHAGFNENEIGIIGHVEGDPVPKPVAMNAPEDNAITALMRGAVLGAFVGAFIMLVIPGISAVAGLGRWFDVLGGAVLGAVMSGVLIAFGSFFFSRSRTQLYAAALEKGNFIVTVSNPRRTEEAASVLRQQGAQVERH